jgi:hypothetical protein
MTIAAAARVLRVHRGFTLRVTAADECALVRQALYPPFMAPTVLVICSSSAPEAADIPLLALP